LLSKFIVNIAQASSRLAVKTLILFE
jgi:hypothetical protein